MNIKCQEDNKTNISMKKCVPFTAKTNEAYHLKILAELLTNNLKTGCFEISDNGISLRQMDAHRKTLIDLQLNSENFSVYKFKPDYKTFLGLNLNHFHKMLKSIKKKDSVEIFINENFPLDLGIKAIPKENTRITTSCIKIQNIQNLDIDLPTGYGKPVIVKSSEFQKMTKDMLSIDSSIEVTAHDFHISFKCNAGGIIKRTVEFGEPQENSEKDSFEYNQEFATEQLGRITKIAGLSDTMQIFSPPSSELPLLFKSRVGSLGIISVYIKSKDQIKESKEDSEEEDSS